MAESSDTIDIIRSCTQEEAKNHLAYLHECSHQPGGSWTPPPERSFRWWIAKFPTANTLGSIPTIFDFPNVPVRELTRWFREKYDHVRLGKVEEFRASLRASSLPPVVTLVECRGQC